MTQSEYEKQAGAFLDKYGIQFGFVYKGARMRWGAMRCEFLVRLTRENRHFTFQFWGSNYDYEQGIKVITPYDVLACISGDHHYETEDDIYNTFGSDTHYMDTEAMLEQARLMRSFFTPQMLEDLEQIV